jgi:NhaB family Na+:H+ antiporter
MTIAVFILINPLLFYINPFLAGWVLILEFIFTLAFALVCYPLPAGGLLAIEAVILGMASPSSVYNEVAQNLPVLLLLMFMVAGVHFMKEGLLVLFTRILLKFRSKILLSMVFCGLGAFLSAFLDALTVTAVVISVAYGFFTLYKKFDEASTLANNPLPKEDMQEFKGFLRNLMMHAAVGTTLGGAMTLVGEPQNLLIGERLGWRFADFFRNCSPVSVPVGISGIFTCFLLEKFKFWGYGYKLPDGVRKVLAKSEKDLSASIDSAMRLRLIIQGVVGVLLVFALAFHLAEVGFIGLSVIIILTAFNGIVKEEEFGGAFHDGLPFTALLVVFFSIVAVIHDLHLFAPITKIVLAAEGEKQLLLLFLANGALSMISDNVFVATVYINELQAAFQAGAFDHAWYSKLAVSVNMGTNVPSIATPNGQAAFLFLLTSSLAPLIRLSYIEMMKLALPYTIIMTSIGLLATRFLL